MLEGMEGCITKKNPIGVDIIKGRCIRMSNMINKNLCLFNQTKIQLTSE